MLKKPFVFALTGLAVTAAFVSGCGTQPKEETLSVIDENHFDQLASAPGDAAGNASANIEILADGTAAQGQAGNPQGGVMIENVPAGGSEAILQAPSMGTVTGSSANTFEQKVQLALKNAGYYAGDIDGKIGQKTREAIKSFQTANGLKSDGVVGPSTWEKLKRYTSSTSTGNA